VCVCERERGECECVCVLGRHCIQSVKSVKLYNMYTDNFHRQQACVLSSILQSNDTLYK